MIISLDVPRITQQLDLKGFQLWTTHARETAIGFPLFRFFDDGWLHSV